MNFSEFLDSIQDPIYEEKGKEPKCPGGHKWDEKLKKCVPGEGKKGDTKGEQELPDPLASFDVWGATGLNGDGYAMEEGLSLTSKYNLSRRERERDESNNRAAKEQDNRMRFGKKGRPSEGDTPLRRGEVKRWDRELGRWVSNKEGK